MAEAGANIEDAAATSMSAGRLDGASGEGPSFLCSAFYTHIRPHDFDSAGIHLAIGVFVKASIVEEAVPFVTESLYRRFPQLVCTVTEGGYLDAPEVACDDGEGVNTLTGGYRTATMRFFGKDKPGQLAKITEVLHECRVTILNLLVTTGFANSETGEFIERAGGPLSENNIAVAVFDEASFDEDECRRKLEEAAVLAGYVVSSFIWDKEENRAQETATYHLRRKAYLAQVAAASQIAAVSSSQM